MPIILVIAFGILSAILFLSVPTIMTRRATEELQQLAERACTEAGRYVARPQRAISAFAAQVNQYGASSATKYSTLTRARLTIPTMPKGSQFGHFEAANPNQYLPTFYANNTPGYDYVEGVSFAGIPIDENGDGLNDFACNLGNGSNCEALNARGFNCDEDCRFRGQTKDGSGAALPGIPDYLVKDVEQANALAICEFSAVVKFALGIFGEAELNVKSARALEPRGKFETFDGAEGFDRDNPVGSRPGFTIAIAPEMTTNSNSPRFTFSTGTAPDYLNSERQNLDPTFQLNTPYQEVPAFQVPFFSGQASPDYSQYRTGPSATAFVSQPLEVTTALPLPHDNEFNLRNMMVACENPGILVRNVFTSEILELLSRTGATRNTTELLVVPPMNLGKTTSSTAYESPPNSPIFVTQVGQDLAAAEYQIPFVTYDSGSTQVLGLPAPKGGPIDPIVNSTSSPPTMKQRHHALFASQLRACYHLYTQPLTGNPAIPSSTNPEYGLARSSLGFASNAPLFEYSDQGRPFYAYAPNLRPERYPFGTVDGLWDQPCPWDTPACHELGFAKGRGLTAAEVASILGSVQSCPYAQSDLTSVIGVPVCIKPNPKNDLRPDLVGLLYYLGRMDTPVAGCGWTFGAVNSPGLWEHNVSPCYAFGRDRYTQVPRKSSHVLYVTHHRLEAGEKAELMRVLGGANTDDPPNDLQDVISQHTFTVVLIPASPGDASAAAIQDYMDVFRIPAAGNREANENAIYVFSPYSFSGSGAASPCPFPGLGFNCGGRTNSEEQMFQQYWYFMLHDSQFGIKARAEEIFFNRLMKSRLLL